MQIKDTLPNFREKFFASSFSNGASMTRENPELISAVAPIAESDWIPDLVPKSSPPKLFYIPGPEDSLNPFEGGDIFIGTSYAGTKPDVEEMILRWTILLNCENQFTTNTDRDIRTYQFDCANDNELILLP